MSLTKRLIVITNNSEDIFHACSIENSIEDIASVIKRGLDKDRFNKLLKRLKSSKKFDWETY